MPDKCPRDGTLGIDQAIKSPGLRSQSPGFSGLFVKTSRFACNGEWKVQTLEKLLFWIAFLSCDEYQPIMLSQVYEI